MPELTYADALNAALREEMARDERVSMEAAFDELDAPIERVASANVPVPFAPVLEAAVSPQVEATVAAVRRALGLTQAAQPKEVSR